MTKKRQTWLPRLLLVDGKEKLAQKAVAAYAAKEKLSVVNEVNSWRGENHLLRVEMVRDWIDGLQQQYDQEEATYLLIDIDQAHSGAQNALLKTLEEPPAGVRILMTAGHLGAVLPTILSRIEVIDLRSLNTEKTGLAETGLVGNILNKEKSATAGEVIVWVENELKTRLEEDLKIEPLAEKETKNSRETRAAAEIITEATMACYQHLKKSCDINDCAAARYYQTALYQLQMAYQLLQTNVSPRLILEDCFLQIL